VLAFSCTEKNCQATRTSCCPDMDWLSSFTAASGTAINLIDDQETDSGRANMWEVPSRLRATSSRVWQTGGVATPIETCAAGSRAQAGQPRFCSHVKTGILMEQTLLSLATLVREMRDLQKRFFKQHDYQLLARCKQLEKQVDEVCEDICDQQPKLF
jgi:hypothetical protein